MKLTFLAIIFALFLIPCLAQTDKSDLVLTGEIINFNKKELSLRYRLKNRSNEVIYISINPKQVNGEPGYYLTLDNTDNSLLRISSRVYQVSNWTHPNPYKMGVELKILKPSETYDERVFIKIPSRESSIYDGSVPRNKRIITSKKIKKVELEIGYFIEDEGILNFLERKPFGWFIQGEETISKGKNKDKSFLEIQNLATFNISI